MSIVYLIGAGPGDPGSSPSAACSASRRPTSCCTTISCTRGCCARARADAEKIDVGIAAPQPLEQEAICYLLAEKAREGKIVARLKWGDPFVFDRGGAEALFLHEQGVRFEVVPGIPAGIARAELRRRADHLSRRRRHADVRPRPRGRGQDAARRSTGRASRGSTARIVCYAGPAAAAADAATRCSRTAARRTTRRRSIYDGTLPTQETIAGTLDEIARARRAVDRSAPGDARRRPRRRRCASTCAGSTRGRCSASACW